MNGDQLGSVWASPLLRALPEEDLQILLTACRVSHVEVGRQVLRAEDDLVAIIARGAAKAHALTPDGDQVIVAMLGPGESWGYGVALGYHLGGTDLTAVEPVDALLLPGSELRALLVSRPAVATACLRAVGRQLAGAQAELLRFAGTSTADRVTHRILELATRWGREEGERVTITLPLTQDELASWASASRESTAKVLHRLRNAGVIATGRRTMAVLDMDDLRRRCDQGPTETVIDLVESLRSSETAQRRHTGPG
jgi:CRP/FNR family transcriptional regulator, cyclic AMP receptor protein